LLYSAELEEADLYTDWEMVLVVPAGPGKMVAHIDLLVDPGTEEVHTDPLADPDKEDLFRLVVNNLDHLD